VKIRLLVVFTTTGFLMKILSEVIHEVAGHGLFVYILGGEVTSVHISILWPYSLSYVTFKPPPGGFDRWENCLVYASGILVCLAFAFLSQLATVKTERMTLSMG